jgi:hypothetical protein
MLRYAPGASVPRHRHLGLETIFALSFALNNAFRLRRRPDTGDEGGRLQPKWQRESRQSKP